MTYGVRFMVVLWVAMLLSISLLIADYAQDDSPYNQQIDISHDRHADIDYHNGGWYVDGQRVHFYCPEEDTCQTQWNGDNWWLFKPTS